MKRNPRNTAWTKAYRLTHGKELVQDATYDFEKKRNLGIKYDRSLVGKVLTAMKKVEDVKVKRQDQFWKTRMKVKVPQEKLEAARVLAWADDRRVSVSTLYQDGSDVDDKEKVEEVEQAEEMEMEMETEEPVDVDFDIEAAPKIVSARKKAFSKQKTLVSQKSKKRQMVKIE